MWLTDTEALGRGASSGIKSLGNIPGALTSKLLDIGAEPYNKRKTGATMDIVEEARAYERKYHEDLYRNHALFEHGTWLYKPAAYAIKSFTLVSKEQNIRVLDLGGGVGRHSIPAAKYFGPNSKVICVDLLGPAIERLKQNAHEHNVDNIFGVESDVETYDLHDKPYDLILSISCVEHVPTKARLEKLICRLQNATKIGGVHCFMIITNNEWVELGTNKKTHPTH